MNGTRLSAVLDGQVAGHIEVDIFEGGERLPRHGGWADIGDLHVAPDYRRRGVATWLLAEAGWWLGLAQVSRVLDYAALGTDPAARTTPVTGRSWPRRASPSSPGPSAAGPGARRSASRILSVAARSVRSWPFSR